MTEARINYTIPFLGLYALLILLVYTGTPNGQNVVKALKQGRYIVPTDVFAYSTIYAVFFDLLSQRFPMFEELLAEYCAVCMMLAFSSVIDLFLYCYGFALPWIAYAPSVFLFALVIRGSVYKLFFSKVVSDSPMRETLPVDGNLHDEKPERSFICR